MLGIPEDAGSRGVVALKDPSASGDPVGADALALVTAVSVSATNGKAKVCISQDGKVFYHAHSAHGVVPGCRVMLFGGGGFRAVEEELTGHFCITPEILDGDTMVLFTRPDGNETYTPVGAAINDLLSKGLLQEPVVMLFHVIEGAA